jgi:hypothetical protein
MAALRGEGRRRGDASRVGVGVGVGVGVAGEWREEAEGQTGQEERCAA